jgi:hypothetical protein
MRYKEKGKVCTVTEVAGNTIMVKCGRDGRVKPVWRDKLDDVRWMPMTKRRPY